VYLKSLTLKGFKSFPDRTRLDFGPGVSVVVGPNGSGKSNITDAVLWAMGEQSPLAVRGQSMQDVIFGGGRGVQARSAAEVELVLDNSDGTVGLPLAEISILRRLHRSGEGEYRLNGARCRLVDVIEVLSDTGLGKETHSVISQGRVEAIVTSKPRDRRLLIEEAAGLGKHRKRRRRAQLKLERTQDNLDRALDVEREARSRLRPLKRQAEAAELHARLERQALEARLLLARETLRVRRLELAGAEALVQEARAARAEVEGGLREVVARRSLAERALGERSARHDELSRRALHAGAAAERLQLRHEQAAVTAAGLAERVLRSAREIELLEESSAEGEGGALDADGASRIGAIERELAGLDLEREQQLARELAELELARETAAGEVAELDATLADAREAREAADEHADGARGALREAERAVEAARRDAARVGSELAAVNQFLRTSSAVGGTAEESQPGGGSGDGAPRALSEALRVAPGYELALAAALGGRLDAALVPDLAGASALLDRAGPDGAIALLAERGMLAEGECLPASVETGMPAETGTRAEGECPPASAEARASEPPPADVSAPPAPGARPLIELVEGPAPVLALARRLLADAWVLERLEDLPRDFAGVAVTPRGRVWFAALGEVRQVAEGGSERVLARRNEREQLILASEAAAATEHAARGAAEHAQEAAAAADLAREEADGALRESARAHAHALEGERHAAWLIEQRRAAPEQGPLAVRRAQLEGELAAERRTAERLAREHAERLERLARLRAGHAADTALAPRAERLAVALHAAGEAVAACAGELQQELDTYRAAGEEMAAELRACAAAEAEIQARLRAQGEAVTAAEVSAQRLRDHTDEALIELRTVREQLELPAAEGATGVATEGGSEGAAEGTAGEDGSDSEGAARAGDARDESVAQESQPQPGMAAMGDGADEHEAGECEVEVGEPRDAQSAEGESGEPAGAHGRDLGWDDEDPEPLDAEQVQALTARLERLRRRREQLGPVNPLAKEEYAEALAHVEELEARRSDLETALRELRTLIRDTDRQIHETFRATFEAAARNFEELAGDLFPGGGGQLRLVKDALAPRPVLGGQPLPGAAAGGGSGAGGGEERDGEAAAEREERAGVGRAAAGSGDGEGGDGEGRRALYGEGGDGGDGDSGDGGDGAGGDALDHAGSAYDPGEELLGVEIEITPAGKSTKRLSLLSGGEKSMTALAFLFAVFLARPCPFYILDEVEAALDDLNLERFLSLLRRYANRAQFIVITHQKRTMEAADWLYGVSMAGNGVSKVLSRRLPPAAQAPLDAALAPVSQPIPGRASESTQELAHQTTPEVEDAADGPGPVAQAVSTPEPIPEPQSGMAEGADTEHADADAPSHVAEHADLAEVA
jgi:chromosome segregation protein